MLSKAGYEVIGVTMSIWGGKSSSEIKGKNACYGPNEKEDIEEAQKVCKETRHSILCLRLCRKIRKNCAENFRREYVAGRTPNPCRWCNSQIKFGALPMLAAELGIDFDKFATGHYARISYSQENNRYIIKTAVDERKDQTYFLYRLTQEQLSGIIFPLGDYLKEQIREIARKNNLHVSEKEESQDFYSGDYNELLSVGSKNGNIVDAQGNILGRHEGIWNYTIGQRKGIGIAADRPLYVVELNKETNEVIVGYEEETYDKMLLASQLNWIAIERLDSELEAKVKIRSSQQPKNAIIRNYSEDRIFVEFEDPQKAVTPGQSVVFYKDDAVLGGGIIN